MLLKPLKSYFITRKFSRHKSHKAIEPYLHFIDDDDTDCADVGTDFDVTLVKQAQI